MKQICLFFCLATLLMLSSCGGSRPAYTPVYQEPAAAAAARPEQPEIVMYRAYYASNDSLHLFFRFEDVRQLLNLQQAAARVDYTIRAGATERDMLIHRDTIQLAGEHRVEADGTVQVPVSLPAAFATGGNIMQVRLWLKTTGQERLGLSHRLTLRPEMLQKHYLLLQAETGRPFYRNFATTADRLTLLRNNATGATQTVPVIKVESAFLPALPPMSTRQETLPTLPQQAGDSLRLSSGDTVQFTAEGLYLINAGAASQSGLLVQEGGYPLVTRVKDMISPLIYLTTSAEREALYNAKDQKAAVDNFWLKAGRDKSVARDLIRTYYTRVETANKLFTSFKPGWATDRGMIYIIYGKPSNISVNGDAETWIYRETEVSPYVKFVFTKKENNFTENHFELVRNREYEENWYSTVAKWRAGITSM